MDVESHRSLLICSQNGEITDPPVATTDEAPLNHSFAKAIPPPGWSTASTKDLVFCQTCIKNQHLFRSSLAQYLPEDPNHPDYAILSRNLENFQKQLEERYPQVCENCVDRVHDRMKRAVYGAKVDAYGRQLERTRLNRAPGNRRKQTWLECIQDWGRIIWAWGIYLQLACEVMALIEGFRPTSNDSFEDDLVLSGGPGTSMVHSFYSLFDALTSFMSYLPDIVQSRLPEPATSSLLLSLSCIWWNPEFRYTIKNGLHEVHGLQNWYIHQAVLFLLRGLLWYARGTCVLNNAQASKTLAAHSFVLAFTAWISATTTKKVTVRSKPLFSSTPDRAALITKRKGTMSPNNEPNTLYEALNNIAQEPAVAPSPISPAVTPVRGNLNQRKSWESQGFTSDISYIDRRTPSRPNSTMDISRSKSLFTDTSGQGTARYSSSFDLSLPMQVVEASDPDEMEWTPSRSEYRAFNSGLSTQREAQPFNQAPSGPQPSTFWYKVPPAPITPARKLRNPPNQPLLSAPSDEVKQNFFNQMTMDMQQSPTPLPDANSIRKDYQFAQPKFFPPDAFGDSTGLADAFGKAFNIEEREAAEKERVSLRNTQTDSTSPKSELSGNFTWVALGVLLWFWNLSYSRPTEYSRYITLASMVVCILIGCRSFIDHATIAFAKTSSNSSIVGVVMATFETAAAFYILVVLKPGFPEAIRSGRSYGSLLIGFMMVRQLFERYGMSPLRVR